nr:MAG TPA: hypothetical protein [Caudoviricetes sp.]
MERLTKRSPETTHENGVCCTHFNGLECFSVNGNCSMGCPWEEAAWERLADYEDTGLGPEEIVKMGMAYEDSKRYAARLEGRIKAYGEGRIVVLPCKVGDELWTNISIQGDRYRQSDRPYRVKVVFIGMGPETAFFHIQYSNGRIFPVDKEQFGKTVFLTREEAEKALEGK